MTTHPTSDAPPVSALYSGNVMHLRMPEPGGPRKRHQFRYSVFRLLLDLDRLPDIERGLRLFSVGRWNLLSFRAADHGPCDGGDLRRWADDQLALAGMERPARVLLYCFPRVLGYVFNPLSVYFCLREDGTPSAVIYEVRNTLGDLHPYVIRLDGQGQGTARHSVEKSFYVSPFISEEQRYGFTLTGAAGDTQSLRIRLDGTQGLTLIATENMRRAPLTDRAILRQCLRMPFMTAKIIIGIYWEAVRLRLKGARMFPYPGVSGLFARNVDRAGI